MVTAINHKGTRCNYRSLLCQEGYCKECQIAIDAIDKATSKLGLCPVCGTDIKVYEELFGEKHYCDPKWR